MAEALFVFIQMEFPQALGPPPGRYLLRSPESGEPQHVVVIGLVGAARADERRGGGRGRRLRRARRGGRGPDREASAQPQPVLLERVTIIDPIPLSAEQQARAWLEGLDREHDVQAAFATLNRVLNAHRIAAADPYVHEVSPAQALVVRAGWGAGEQVADGRWLHAGELPLQGARAAPDGQPPARPLRRRGGRSAALRPVERLAVLLGGRGRPLVCEELALRARLDLDGGRVRHAALELERAYAAALAELAAEGNARLALRLDELRKLRDGVCAQARAAIPAAAAAPPAAGDAERRDGPEAAAQSEGGAAPPALDEQTIAHALARLEAALRARALEQLAGGGSSTLRS